MNGISSCNYVIEINKELDIFSGSYLSTLRIGPLESKDNFILVFKAQRLLC
jgi:hypothetical protein